MTITIGGAVRHKKLYIGKQVKVSGENGRLDCSARVVDIQNDILLLELFATSVYPHDRLLCAPAVDLIFIVPDDAAYRCRCQVMSYSDTAQILQIRQDTPVQRVDQRHHYRLQTSRLIYIAPAPEKDAMATDWREAGLLDISRGGARVMTSQAFSVGSKVRLLIPLDEVGCVVECNAIVVRESVGKDGQSVFGLRYDDLPLSEQERILDFILKLWTEKKDEQQTG